MPIEPDTDSFRPKGLAAALAPGCFVPPVLVALDAIEASADGDNLGASIVAILALILLSASAPLSVVVLTRAKGARKGFIPLSAVTCCVLFAGLVFVAVAVLATGGRFFRN